ncbi:unnamed protein product [Rhizoctonia solani]|uniref:Uncharacterized protein n=1 Tax=Rhizoctonia solani TaxID=456999 RepID=A0A8H3AYI7_9AGAM|nr:unnamed protein product [Rhizoctonia solani]
MFYNPDLSMHLSQYLFSAQMAVFKSAYSMSLMPGDKSIFTPPELPSHIPGTLKQVSGTPSDEEIKSVQSVLRSVENLATRTGPQLFDTDLSMKLSQHMFNLQFGTPARYMHNSSAGQFVSENELEGPHPIAIKYTQDAQDLAMPRGSLNLRDEEGKAPITPSDITQLGEKIVKAIEDTSSESKEMLKSMNRVLVSMKNDQSTAGCMAGHYHVFKNPLNKKGLLASECGLPHLRYWWDNPTSKFMLWLSRDDTARYLKFFEIGVHLIQGDKDPKLINGKDGEAEKLLLKQVGIHYGHYA